MNTSSHKNGHERGVLYTTVPKTKSARVLSHGFDLELEHQGPCCHCGAYTAGIGLDSIRHARQGEDLLEVTLPLAHEQLREFEHGVRGVSEWCIPAHFLNEHARVRIVEPATATTYEYPFAGCLLFTEEIPSKADVYDSELEQGSSTSDGERAPAM